MRRPKSKERFLPRLASIIKFILIAVGITPLIVVLPEFTLVSHPYIIGKTIYSWVLIELAFALWIPLILYDKSYRPRLSYIIVLMFLFLVVSLAAGVFGASPARSFWSTHERMSGVVNLAIYTTYALMLVSMFRGIKEWIPVFMVFAICGGITALFGAWGYLFDTPFSQWVARDSGGRLVLVSTFGNSLFAGAYFGITVGLAFLLMHYVQTLWVRIILALVIIPCLPALWLTAARGSFGAFALMLMVLIAGHMFIGGRILKYASAALLSILVLGVVSLSVMIFTGAPEILRLGPAIDKLESTVRGTDFSRMDRLVALDNTMQSTKRHPIFGVGPSNFSVVWGKELPYHYQIHRGTRFLDDAHNKPAEVLATTGTVGLLVYLTILGVIAERLWFLFSNGKDRRMAILMAGVLTMYFASSMFLIENPSYTLIFIALCAYLASTESRAWPSFGIPFQIKVPLKMPEIRTKIPKIPNRILAASRSMVMAKSLVAIFLIVFAAGFYLNMNILSSARLVTGVHPITTSLRQYDRIEDFHYLGNFWRVRIWGAIAVHVKDETPERVDILHSIIEEDIATAMAMEPDNFMYPFVAFRVYREFVKVDKKFEKDRDRYLDIVQKLSPRYFRYGSWQVRQDNKRETEM